MLTTYTGTAKESGKKLHMLAAHVWKIRDGKVASFHQLADSATLNEALAVEAAV